jgi:hypothetical protein
LDFVLAILVLAATLAALGYPLYRARTQAAMVNASTLDDLLAQRDGVYATLRDLELDQQLGKLDVADYNALREKYMARATEILQELDMLRGEDGGEANAEIEKEVAALRKGSQTREMLAARSENREPRVRVKDTRTETARPERNEGSDGKRQEAKLYCTNCGRPYKVGDKFCARCGHALK